MTEQTDNQKADWQASWESNEDAQLDSWLTATRAAPCLAGRSFATSPSSRNTINSRLSRISG